VLHRGSWFRTHLPAARRSTSHQVDLRRQPFQSTNHCLVAAVDSRIRIAADCNPAARSIVDCRAAGSILVVGTAADRVFEGIAVTVAIVLVMRVVQVEAPSSLCRRLGSEPAASKWAVVAQLRI